MTNSRSSQSAYIHQALNQRENHRAPATLVLKVQLLDPIEVVLKPTASRRPPALLVVRYADEQCRLVVIAGYRPLLSPPHMCWCPYQVVKGALGTQAVNGYFEK